jgi:phosphonate transport system ATP-binding protein
MLRIEQVVKRYAGGEEALQGVDLEVPDGQILAVVGPSGAGKSTLIRCVNRLVEPTTGRVFLRDLELTGLRGRALRSARRRVGMIFQEFALIERLSVMDNVLSGCLGRIGFWRSLLRRFPDGDVRRALVLAERIGIGGLLHKRADSLSGGQRQRVGIARALMQTNELLLVDEPTANLDPKTARSILRLLAELTREQGTTAIVNLHDIPLAQLFADRVVGLRAGRIVFDGPPSGLSPAVLTEIYGEEDWHGPPAEGAAP